MRNQTLFQRIMPLFAGLVMLALGAIGSTESRASTFAAAAPAALVSIGVKREGKDEIVQLDAAKDSFAGDLTNVITLKVQEATAPLAEKVTKLEADNTALKDVLVGEIVRLKRIEGEADVKAETDYLSGLSVERLKMEFDRTNKQPAAIKQVTNGDAPQGHDAEWGVVKTEN